MCGCFAYMHVHYFEPSFTEAKTPGTGVKNGCEPMIVIELGPSEKAASSFTR